MTDSIIIFAGTAALKERKQSASVMKLYWYTSVSATVEVESIREDKDVRAARLLAAYSNLVPYNCSGAVTGL